MKKILISTLLPLLVLGVYMGGRYIYFKPKMVNGETAPAFTATLKDGTSFALNDLKGQYVLLDFWGSWCGPCRAESPNLKALYEKYKPQRFANGETFEILSVGIEKNPKSWEAAIQKDQLQWKYHILDQGSSLRFFDSPIAGIYQIREVPTKFLLDPKGRIIAVNPSYEELQKLLDSRL
ncbi:MAG: TlpA disulfide reductase family protein [Bacteroidota bacterium]